MFFDSTKVKSVTAEEVADFRKSQKARKNIILNQISALNAELSDMDETI